jgi:methylglutaconyl-CoA hydratase
MKIHKTIRLELDGRVATVFLNRPDVRNAFHPTMISELTEAFHEIATRTDLDVTVLKGEGKSFCAGADLGYMQSMAQFTFEENKQDSEKLYDMFWALRSVPQPVIGLVHGHVMGGALGLLAMCDVAAAVDGTQFCFSEARLGLAPAVISPFVMEKAQACFVRRYFLSAEVFDVQSARDAGLVQASGNAEECSAFVARMTSTFLANGPQAVRASKALIRFSETNGDWHARRSFTTQTIAERRVSEEGQEGLKSYFEKRKPTWAGDSK